MYLFVLSCEINEIRPFTHSTHQRFHSPVAPMVRAPSQLLGTPLGSDVQLECQVEASPSPVSYWLKGARTSNGFASVSTASLESGSPGPEMLLDG